ncbi:MAG TPA: ABC transporter permease [Puia sp.]|nr:ABC transporter permease [Puia sp.]
MFKNYLKIAIRNLSRQKILSFINVSGLSIGIACFSLFLLYAVNEFSYDRWHKNAGRIFRVNEAWKAEDGREGRMAGLNMPLGPALKKEFPDVEDFVRFNAGGENVVRANNKTLRLSMGFADPALFSVFSFPLLKGADSSPLKDPHAIVLTKTTALQLYGGLDCIGKTVQIKMNPDDKQANDGFQPFVVSAVADDIPANSSIQFAVLGSYDYIAAAEFRKEGLNNWHMTFGDETYVQLSKESRLDKDPGRLLNFRLKHYPEEAASYAKTKKASASFELRPLRMTHISADIESGAPGSATDPRNIWILIGIASGILLIACINFTTLAIGRSAGRAKEVGIRKVMGGKRKQLALQFLTESMLLSIFSACIGLLLADILLPYFSQLCGRTLHFSFSQFPELIWLLGGLTLVVGLLAGSYPALVLSGFRPVEVLKSRIRLGGANVFTRGLVSFQFVLSAVLIISTLIIFRQLNFMRSKNIGFNKENVVAVHTDGTESRRIYPLFRQALQSQREIAGMAGAEIGLGEGQGEMGDQYTLKGKNLFSIIYPVDADYLKVMGMQLIAGRNFNAAIPGDSAGSIMINENFAKNNLGKDAGRAVGMQLQQGRDAGGRTVTVIGVVKDYNFEPLTKLVRPQSFTMPGGFHPNIFFVRIQPGDPVTALNLLKKTWSGLAPDLEFRYSFLDEDLDRFYKSEEKWSRVAGWAGGISIFLACLGLFGLAALAIVNRTREIGIRKVLGASVGSIVQLVTGNFLRLVVIALLIAAPVSWYIMQKWLQDYAYRIDIGWWVFVVTGAIALVVAFVTVGYHAVRAGVANPVDSLRSE